MTDVAGERASLLQESPESVEEAYLEYRRAGYELLRRGAAERGLFDALEQPSDEREALERMGFARDRAASIMGLLLQALARYGALETDGSRYWASGTARRDADDFDRELIRRATGSDDFGSMLHGGSYARLVDSLFSDQNDVGSAFVRENMAIWDEFLQTPFYAYFRARAVQAVSAPGAAVLDLACGPGYGLAEVAAEVGDEGRVVGVDVSRDFVEEAVRRVHEPNVHPLPGNLDEGLPFLRDGFFDGALLVGAYHFLTDRESLMETAARVLKPGGRLCLAYVYLTVGSPDQELMDLRLALREPLARPTTREELEGLAGAHGLRPVETFTVGCFGWHLLERE